MNDSKVLKSKLTAVGIKIHDDMPEPTNIYDGEIRYSYSRYYIGPDELASHLKRENFDNFALHKFTQFNMMQQSDDKPTAGKAICFAAWKTNK